MSANEKTIYTFATRVRQMILKFDEVKQENAELYVDERDQNQGIGGKSWLKRRVITTA